MGIVNREVKKGLDRLVDHAIALRGEGHTWPYIMEDLYMEVSMEGPMDGSKIEKIVNRVTNWAKWIIGETD